MSDLEVKTSNYNILTEFRPVENDFRTRGSKNDVPYDAEVRLQFSVLIKALSIVYFLHLRRWYDKDEDVVPVLMSNGMETLQFMLKTIMLQEYPHLAQSDTISCREIVKKETSITNSDSF